MFIVVQQQLIRTHSRQTHKWGLWQLKLWMDILPGINEVNMHSLAIIGDRYLTLTLNHNHYRRTCHRKRIESNIYASSLISRVTIHL